jgi:hypothetical protein
MTVLLIIRYIAVWNMQEATPAFAKRRHVQQTAQGNPTIFLDI